LKEHILRLTFRDKSRKEVKQVQKEVNNTTAFIVIGVVVAALIGGGIFYFRSSQQKVDPQSPEALQTTQQVNQDYAGTSGRRPPPGTAGNPVR
jgi:hypothetical protein